ncbi:MAG: zinc-dependent alcohol dehydrogenase family protein [Acidobacteriota bacterium]
MRAAIFERFGGEITVRQVPDPVPGAGEAVIRVEATGICRSDWHGWMGHDRDVRLPHVPGHELAGVVESVDSAVRAFRAGDRVTVPFSCGCGDCDQCRAGFANICDRYSQPGFTHWGSFAERVVIRRAELNLVALPESIDFVAAASLGCRFATSWRAVRDQGRLAANEWVAVHGCGGVGLSAIMIAVAMGARVIAVDIEPERLDLALKIGAHAVLNAREHADVAQSVRDTSGGGVHLSIDALGSAETCVNSIGGLRKRGRHVQVGLMTGAALKAAIPWDLIIGRELEIAGSHGLQASRYGEIFSLVASGRIDPALLVGRTISLDEAPAELESMDTFSGSGVTVINRFADHG